MPETDPLAQRAAEVAEFLAGLGSTRDEVYESLKRLGATGGHDSDDCPVHTALAQEFPDLALIRVYQSFTYIEVDDGGAGHVGHPEPVQAFIQAYDDGGAYPDLDSTKEPK